MSFFNSFDSPSTWKKNVQEDDTGEVTRKIFIKPLRSFVQNMHGEKVLVMYLDSSNYAKKEVGKVTIKYSGK